MINHANLTAMPPEKSTDRSRLDEISAELEELREERDRIKTRWELERDLISSIRSMKEEIESLKLKAEDLERRGELAAVAEIRYGRIVSLESERGRAEEKLAALVADDRLLREEVDADDIADVVSRWTGIPVTRMMQTEREKLLSMEDHLGRRVVGQREAVVAVSDAVRRSRAGLQDESRPIGSFIFLGTTGVGKTELARALAEFLFDDERAIVRLDMSEYMEKHSVSRLVGAPPGYVGFDEGGQLTEAVRRRPYSVVLLDEIEKAHPDVFNILLQVLDEGRLTDNKGRTASFRNTIIIMTSNLGSEIIASRLDGLTEENRDELLGDARRTLVDTLRRTIRPEFLNRIDDIVIFNPLTKDEIGQIVGLQIDRVRRLASGNGIDVEVSEEARNWIARLGYDPAFGARPLKRVVQRHLVNPLSTAILDGRVESGDRVSIDLDKAGLISIRSERDGTEIDDEQR